MSNLKGRNAKEEEPVLLRELSAEIDTHELFVPCLDPPLSPLRPRLDRCHRREKGARSRGQQSERERELNSVVGSREKATTINKLQRSRLTRKTLFFVSVPMTSSLVQ